MWEHIQEVLDIRCFRSRLDFGHSKHTVFEEFYSFLTYIWKIM